MCCHRPRVPVGFVRVDRPSTLDCAQALLANSKSGGTHENNDRSRRARRLRRDHRARSEAFFRVRSGPQPTVLAKPGPRRRCREMQETAGAVFDRWRTRGPREPSERRTSARARDAASDGRDSGRDRGRTDVEGRVVLGGQQRRRPNRGRRRHDDLREQRREQRNEGRPCDGSRDGALQRHEHGRRGLAKQERLAVPRIARLPGGHHRARAAAQDLREHRQRRAARLRGRRPERPVRGRARRRLRLRQRHRRVLRGPEGRDHAVRRRTSRARTASS